MHGFPFNLTSFMAVVAEWYHLAQLIIFLLPNWAKWSHRKAILQKGLPGKRPPGKRPPAERPPEKWPPAERPPSKRPPNKKAS